MNSADSERMAGVLENMGYSSTDDLKVANIVVYNTCSIRDKAEQKVRLPQGVYQEETRARFSGLVEARSGISVQPLCPA